MIMWAFVEAKRARAEAERTDLKEGMLLCGLLVLRTGRSRIIVDCGRSWNLVSWCLYVVSKDEIAV